MEPMVSMPLSEYRRLQSNSGKEYRRGYEAGLDTARADFAEVNAHKNELLRAVEALESLLAEARAGRAA